MRAATLFVLFCAIGAFLPSQAAQMTAFAYLQENGYTNYLASVKNVNTSNPTIYEEIMGLLNGTGATPTPITVFAPTNAVTGSGSMMTEQVLFSIVEASSSLGSVSILGNFSFASGSASTVLYTALPGTNLGTTPNLVPFQPPNTTPGSPGQNVMIVQNTSAFTVSYDATQAPLTVSTPDITVTNGYIQSYSAGSIPTPPGSFGNLLTYYKTNSVTFATIAALIPLSVLNVLDSLDGITMLLPTAAGLGALETLTGEGLQNYIESAALGSGPSFTDLSNILSYHILPTPGQLVAYSVPLENNLLAAGAMNLTTGFNSSVLQTLQLSYVAGTLYATSFAPLTAPLTIGGSFDGTATPVDQLFNAGVVHGLNGILLPTAVTLYLPKAIAGLGANSFTSYLTSTGIIANLSTSTAYTVLVPPDSAFTSLNAAYISNAATLASILNMHIIRGVQSSSLTTASGAVLPAGKYTTLNGATIIVGAVSNSAQSVSVSGGSSTTNIVDTTASLSQNGFAFATTGVLLPPSLAAATPTPTPSAGAGSSSYFCLSTVLLAVASTVVASMA